MVSGAIPRSGQPQSFPTNPRRRPWVFFCMNVNSCHFVKRSDNDSRNLGWQARLRWTERPGNDLFMILNQGWQQENAGGLSFHAVDRRLAAKFQYTVRL